MVEELSPLHEHVGVAAVVAGPLAAHDASRDAASAWKRKSVVQAAPVPATWRREAVLVESWQ